MAVTEDCQKTQNHRIGGWRDDDDDDG